MSSGTKILLTLIALFGGVLVIYYGFLMPSPEPGAVVTDPALDLDVAAKPAVVERKTGRETGDRPTVEPGPAGRTGAGRTGEERSVSAPPPTPVATSSGVGEIEMGRPVKPVEPARAAGKETSAPPAGTDQKAGGASAPGPPPVTRRTADRAKTPSASTRLHSTYVVKDGDTLTSIARWWFGDEAKWDLIAEANAIDPNRLSVGQRLRLPPKDAGPSGAGARAARTATTYAVRSGDTLSSIALAHYRDVSKWQTIWEANRAAIGTSPDDLTVGMKLTIPREKSK